MMRAAQLLFAFFLCGAGSGCWHTRGHLTVLAPSGAGGLVLLGEQAVIGEACGRGERESRAFEDALRKRPGAQLLAQTEISDLGRCVRVIGRPAQVAPDAVPPLPSLSAEVAHDGRRAPEGKALVFFYRLDVGGSWRSVRFEFSGVPPFELGDSALAAMTITPGTYNGRMQRARESAATPAWSFEAGRVYYVKVSDQSSYQPGLVYTNVRSVLAVELRDPAFAKAELELLGGG